MAGTINQKTSSLGSVLQQHRDKILAEWVSEMSIASRRRDLMKDSEFEGQCRRFIQMLTQAVSTAGTNVQSGAYDSMREMLAEVSGTRAAQGFSPQETATFVFSMKRPLFNAIREELGNDSSAMAAEIWNATELLDSLGLYTTDVYLKSREGVIRRQQEEMLELSTPVVKLWEGILALPLIGTLDSARTQIVMESLLESIVQTNSRVAIIDITGVPTVDTLVAQHLLKTVTAARLMGADCIISGVRPQIAQTIVHLGINLLDVTTKATMSDAFALALQKTGLLFVRQESRGRKEKHEGDEE